MKRQPQGIPVGGQFAADRKLEPAGSLSGWAEPREVQGPTLAERESAFLEEICGHDGPGAVPGHQARLDACRTEVGRSIMLSSMGKRSTRYELNTGEADTLAELGYESYELVEPLGSDIVLATGMEPERAAVLGTLAGQNLMYNHTHLGEMTAVEKPWAAEAITTLTPAELEDLSGNQSGKDKFSNYRMLVTKNHPERGPIVDRAEALGIRDPGLIESKYDIETLAGIKEAIRTPSTPPSSWQVLQLAKGGHTKETINRYGTAVCDIATAGNLDAMGVSPKAARSFVSRGGIQTAGDMNEYHRAGFTTGRQIQQLNDLSEEGTSVAAKGHMLKAIDPDDLLKWKSQTFSGRFDLSEVRTVAALQKSGFPDPKALDDKYRPHVHTQQDRLYAGTGNGSPIETMGGFVAAKVSPEQAGRLSRAGIPLGKMPELKDSKDPWADGAPYRERYASSYQATPWAFTKDNWEQGN